MAIRLVILPRRPKHPQEAQFRFSSGVIRGSIFVPPTELVEFLHLLAPPLSPLETSLAELQEAIDGEPVELEAIHARLLRFYHMLGRRVTVEGRENLEEGVS